MLECTHSGAPSLSLHHYRLMNVKQVQNDTLSHFILARASTFSLASNEDFTYTQECEQASSIYIANSTEVAVPLFLSPRRRNADSRNPKRRQRTS